MMIDGNNNIPFSVFLRILAIANQFQCGGEYETTSRSQGRARKTHMSFETK